MDNFCNCTGSVECADEIANLIANPLTDAQRTVLTVFIGAATAASGLANGCSLLSLPSRYYKTLYKSFLTSLSLSDLILGLSAGLDNILRVMNDTVEWRLGEAMCHIVPFITTTCVLASSFTLTCVALDRYHGLVSLHEKFQPGLFISIIVNIILWALASGASVPMYLGYIISQNNSACISLCISQTEDLVLYFSSLYGIIFVPLLAIFLFSYFMIARHVWRARLQGQNPNSPCYSTMDNSTSTSPPILRKKPAIAKKKLRTFKVVLFLITIFVICRIPQWTFTLVSMKVSIRSNIGYVVKYILTFLTIMNTAINPLLYSFLENVLNIQNTVFNRIRRCWQLIQLRTMISRNTGTYLVRQ